MRHKVNEWQEFSLKKDIESIKKNMVFCSNFNTVVSFDLTIALLILILEQTILTPWNKNYICSFLLIIAVVPVAQYAYNGIKNWIMRTSLTHKVMSRKDLIDSFDNEICYFVMMADSYHQMLNDTLTSDGNENISEFYCIETWYYINKAKQKLYSMMYQVNYVFTKSASELACGEGVSLYRLKNIVMIIRDIETSINTLIQKQKIIITDPVTIDSNAHYESNYKAFLSEVENNFNYQLI